MFVVVDFVIDSVRKLLDVPSYSLKVVPVLSLVQCHEDVQESGSELHAFLTSALGGDEWTVSRSSRFTFDETAPDIHWIRGWVVPTVWMRWR
jgi:hypothetical protein